MADVPQDAAASYLDAVKWMVGLSGAVIAGVFLHPEVVTHWSGWGRAYVAFVLALFGVSIFSGVVYLLWITRARRRKELIAEIERQQTTPMVIPDPAKAQDLRAQRASLEEEELSAKKLVPRWYAIFTWSFYLGALCGLILFTVQIALAKPKAEDKDKCGKAACNTQVVLPDHPRFTVVQSALHRTQHGMQAHTFLLDQQTGAIWQMICDQKGTIVAFQRVKRVDLNGNLEKDEPAKPK